MARSSPKADPGYRSLRTSVREQPKRLSNQKSPCLWSSGNVGYPDRTPFSSSVRMGNQNEAASAATACCPTASANNCSPWLAHCSPHRVANRCLFRHCLIAPRGTVLVAEKPYASYSASPPQNFISQASTPHERRRQLAPTACSWHVSTAVCASRPEQLHGYPQSHPEIAPSQTLPLSAHRCPSSTTKKRPTESLAQSPNAIQYP
jgi:hypothetical protein